MNTYSNNHASTVLLAIAFGAILPGCGDKPPPAVSSEASKSVINAVPIPEKKAIPDKPDADALLAAKVKALLSGNAELKGLAIDISAKNGIVTLYGTANTKKRRDLAGKLVASVDGVKSVDNELVILAGS